MSKCNSDQILNPKTGKCKKISELAKLYNSGSLKPKDFKSKRDFKKLEREHNKLFSKNQCDDGKMLDPKTNKCDDIDTIVNKYISGKYKNKLSDSVKKQLDDHIGSIHSDCSYGKMRSPKTHRCTDLNKLRKKFSDEELYDFLERNPHKLSKKSRLILSNDKLDHINKKCEYGKMVNPNTSKCTNIDKVVDLYKNNKINRQISRELESEILDHIRSIRSNCDYGKVKNPNTGRCNKITTLQNKFSNVEIDEYLDELEGIDSNQRYLDLLNSDSEEDRLKRFVKSRSKKQKRKNIYKHHKNVHEYKNIFDQINKRKYNFSPVKNYDLSTVAIDNSSPDTREIYSSRYNRFEIPSPEDNFDSRDNRFQIPSPEDNFDSRYNIPNSENYFRPIDNHTDRLEDYDSDDYFDSRDNGFQIPSPEDNLNHRYNRFQIPSPEDDFNPRYNIPNSENYFRPIDNHTDRLEDSDSDDYFKHRKSNRYLYKDTDDEKLLRNITNSYKNDMSENDYNGQLRYSSSEEDFLIPKNRETFNISPDYQDRLRKSSPVFKSNRDNYNFRYNVNDLLSGKEQSFKSKNKNLYRPLDEMYLKKSNLGDEPLDEMNLNPFKLDRRQFFDDVSMKTKPILLSMKELKTVDKSNDLPFYNRQAYFFDDSNSITSRIPTEIDSVNDKKSIDSLEFTSRDAEDIERGLNMFTQKKR